MNTLSIYEQERALELKQFFADQNVSEATLAEQARMDSLSGVGRWKLIQGQSGWPADILDPSHGEI